MDNDREDRKREVEAIADLLCSGGGGLVIALLRERYGQHLVDLIDMLTERAAPGSGSCSCHSVIGDLSARLEDAGLDPTY